ncbi:MAG: cytidylate kinase family protein [Nanoarchaeota archaeon]|nr:cytidylate kinase family protein [Nanoarchaeota archaeon]MBU4242415.1 cytidylate kinase family protein [Nanoarchaeota archaeon]MBU4352765.1 cytidylate kinase family protein [Nanoarchaeota archaeon]MBU4455951.1 cytidylate kinase family protein [Nanoarchaeota archaeon]MCG2720091.1 (d)CMP kinase [Nanoarchaeota archaeon]
MQITIGGVPGAGKSTIAKMLAKELNYEFYSIGNIRRKLASERGLTINEFNSLPENTDQQVDNYQTKLGKEGDNFVVEGRLAFHFIPNSVKFFFDCDLHVAAERIYKNQRKSESTYKTVTETYNALNKRMQNDIERYQRHYKINCYEIKHFDYVIDTTKLTIDEVLKKVMKIIS